MAHEYLLLVEKRLTTSLAAGHSARQCRERKVSGIKYLEYGAERGDSPDVSARRDGIY
jgi:hypothetical protein